MNCFPRIDGKNSDAVQELAELHEKGDNLEAAMKWFEKAADFYGSESAATSANQMRLKVAEFAALDNQ